MHRFHWRSSGFCVLYNRVQCIAEQQHVGSLQAGTGTAHRQRSPPGNAVDSEHTSEAQENKEV